MSDTSAELARRATELIARIDRILATNGGAKGDSDVRLDSGDESEDDVGVGSGVGGSVSKELSPESEPASPAPLASLAPVAPELPAPLAPVSPELPTPAPAPTTFESLQTISSKFTVYGSESCPYSMRAYRMLKDAGHSVAAIDVSTHRESATKVLNALTGANHTTIPLVFVTKSGVSLPSVYFIGGCDDLTQYLKTFDASKGKWHP